MGGVGAGHEVGGAQLGAFGGAGGAAGAHDQGSGVLNVLSGPHVAAEDPAAAGVFPWGGEQAALTGDRFLQGVHEGRGVFARCAEGEGLQDHGLNLAPQCRF